MPLYSVSATRTTTYEVRADSANDAIDAMIDWNVSAKPGPEIVEVDCETTDMRAIPLCPHCRASLDATTTIARDREDEPTYCAACAWETGDDRTGGETAAPAACPHGAAPGRCYLCLGPGDRLTDFDR
jgi:hypothetical protein